MVRDDRRYRSALASLLSLVLLGACLGTGKTSGPNDLDPKFSMSSHIEEGSEVALIVGTRVAMNRERRDYVPFEVAIVNKGVAEGLTLTRESFVLVDQNGSRYPAVGRDELDRSYGNVDIDRRLAEIGPVVRGKYQAYQQMASTLTPSFDKPIERRLFLPRYSFAVDFIYFPHPDTGIRGRRFELFMNAPELPDPIFVKLKVGGKPAPEP